MGYGWISISAFAFLALTCAFALMKGAVADKLGALLVATVNVGADVVMTLSYPHPPQILLFLLDFGLAAGLLVIALRYVSLWLGAAMLLQSIALCGHALRLSGDGLSAFYWMVLNNVISQLMLVCIIVATAVSWRARGKQPKRPDFTFVNDAPAH